MWGNNINNKNPINYTLRCQIEQVVQIKGVWNETLTFIKMCGINKRGVFRLTCICMQYTNNMIYIVVIFFCNNTYLFK
jgi:hypothetical protein